MEESYVEATQAMELEEIEIDLPRLSDIHGPKIINSLTIDQIHKLQSEIEPVKGKGNSTNSAPTSSGGIGIKTNPLKSPKKQSGDEKRRDRKPYRQKIEETGAQMVDSEQVVCLPNNYFTTQPKS
jgi:hypothetical protein